MRAIILLLVWGPLMFQPAFAYFGGKSAYGACSKTETVKPTCSKSKAPVSSCNKKKIVSPGCSKKKCGNPSKSKGKDECNNGGCNPTLGCSSGNFYIHHNFQISIISWLAPKQKTVVTDDNRIINNMSECWHPPEA